MSGSLPAPPIDLTIYLRGFYIMVESGVTFFDPVTDYVTYEFDRVIDDVVRFAPPCHRVELPDWYRAADLVCVPSYSESFGLVALEAQACGTPVVATAVGGLRTAVADGISGVLVDGHDPRAWSSVLARLLQEPQRRVLLSLGAVEHASHFGWDATSRGTLDIYDRVISARIDAAKHIG